MRTGRVKRARRTVRATLRNDRGQSTVEYAVILSVFMVVVAGLGALLQVMDAGVLIDHALSAASHHLQWSAAGVVDVFAY